MKIAIVLFNLGGPCCQIQVKSFLFNLFYDKSIISLPNPFRYMLSSLISKTRNKKATHIYNQLGGGSPILKNTYEQAKALKSSLKNKTNEYEVFLYMRYSYPCINNLKDELALYNPDKVILLSLYPQYSTTTTKSSVELYIKEGLLQKYQTAFIEEYHKHPLFIQAYSELLSEYTKGLTDPIILFSAHGIPINRINKGDPYQKHIETSSTEIAKNFPGAEWLICYQSKVGPLKWLGPSTETMIEKFSKAKRNIVVLPISFVSEHSETLVELDIEYKELALSLGAASYTRIPAVATHPKYIECLKDLVIQYE